MPVVNPGGSPWVSLGIGYGQTCAMTADGELDCWGQVTSSVPYETAETPLRIESDQAYGIADIVLSGFLRITTHP